MGKKQLLAGVALLLALGLCACSGMGEPAGGENPEIQQRSVPPAIEEL